MYSYRPSIFDFRVSIFHFLSTAADKTIELGLTGTEIQLITNYLVVLFVNRILVSLLCQFKPVGLETEQMNQLFYLYR
jgi:hypothetical protein